MIKVEWRGKAIYIVHRTPQMLAQLDRHERPLLRDPESKDSEQPDVREERVRARSSPSIWCWSASARTSAARRSTAFTPGDADLGADWPGGFFCPCHGSKFDLAGPRVQGRAGAART